MEECAGSTSQSWVSACDGSGCFYVCSLLPSAAKNAKSAAVDVVVLALRLNGGVVDGDIAPKQTVQSGLGVKQRLEQGLGLGAFVRVDTKTANDQVCVCVCV
jgi:hypothetical protein